MRLKTQRYWPIAAFFIASISFLLIYGGGARVRPWVAKDRAPIRASVRNIKGGLDLFDGSAVHSISIELGAEAKEKMESTYRETGRKDWFPAVAVVDGARIGPVGIRLKGNSTLESIFGAPRGAFAAGPPEKPTGPNSGPGSLGMERPPGMIAGGGPARDASRGIPYLIKFDAFEEGLRYQGRSEIALRVRGHMGEDAAFFAELLTRYALSYAGLSVPALAYCGVSLDGAKESLYLVAEHLDEPYIERTTGKSISGSILYKALPRGNFAYRGEDPSVYDAYFSQETNKKVDDFTPLIGLIRFASSSDGPTFQKEIDGRIDREALAAYLAANNILVNFDSLGGNGNNYYLLYGKESGRFTVLAWDLNESLGQFWLSRNDPAALGLDYGSDFPIRHPLLDRNLADGDFRALYTEKLAALADGLLFKGALSKEMDRWASVFEPANAVRHLLDPAAYRASAEWAGRFLARRSAYLNGKTGDRAVH